MARKFPPAALSTGRNSLLGLALATVILICPALQAAETDTADSTTVLKPYSADYKTSARGMTVTLERELKSDSDGNYTLTNGGKLLVVGFHEVALFRIQEGQVKPRSYIYQGTGLINRRREVHFTPGADTVRSLYKDEWYELPYTEGTLDRLSQQEQLRLHLLNAEDPRQDIQLRVADGKRIKDYTLVYRGDEIVDTPLGSVNTLHFERPHDDSERESDIWIAPEWDFLMVKTIHVEDGKPVEILLSDATIAGDRVEVATAPDT
jgi:hypothetical protein